MDLRSLSLSSPRLRLTAFTPADADEVFEAVTPTLTRFLRFEPSPSREAFAEIWATWFPRMAAGIEVSLVVRSTGGEFLGMAGLHAIGDPEPETGIWIKEAAHGRGYGREAVATVIAWAGRELGAAAVRYPVAEANTASRRLAESLGGIAVGTGILPKPGIDHPMVVYRIPAR